MGKLTYRGYDGFYNTSLDISNSFCRNQLLGELGRYEDTGLSPQGIRNLIKENDELRELIKLMLAEKQMIVETANNMERTCK